MTEEDYNWINKVLDTNYKKTKIDFSWIDLDMKIRKFKAEPTEWAHYASDYDLSKMTILGTLNNNSKLSLEEQKVFNEHYFSALDYIKKFQING